MSARPPVSWGRGSWRAFGTVCAAAFAVRACYLLAAGPDPRLALVPDSMGYLQAARNLARHGTFSLSEGPPLAPDTVRTPGYPLLVAVLSAGEPALGFLWLQALLGALSAGLVYAAGLALWREESAAWAAGLGLALDAVIVMHTGLVLTETLFVLVFSAAFLSLARAFAGEKPSGYAAAGLGFGLTALVRPVGLYYFAFAAAALLGGWAAREGLTGRGPWSRVLTRARVACLALFLGASSLIPLLWMTRNKLAAGAFTFCSIQGLNFVVRAFSVQGELTGLGAVEVQASVQRMIREAYPEGFSSPQDESRKVGLWATRFILSHPIGYLRVMLKDTVKMLGGHGMEIAAWALLKDSVYDPMHGVPASGGFAGTRGLLRRHPVLGAAFALYVLGLAAVYGLAAWGLAASWRGGQAGEAILALSPVLYFLAVTVGLGAYYRLRIPLMPAVFLLAGRGAAELVKNNGSAPPDGKIAPP